MNTKNVEEIVGKLTMKAREMQASNILGCVLLFY
jgi:hypothetical protein